MIYSKFDITKKRILVTGGAQGIGKCVAEIMADCGAYVGILDINGDKASQVAQSIGKNAFAITCDVTNPVQVKSAFNEFVHHFGGLDAVFNNAGIVIHNDAEKVSPEEFQQVIDVNINGVFYVAQAAANEFIRAGTGGSIVNTASMSGSIVNIPQRQTSYNTSKAAVVHLTKSLAVEWAEKGIRVNSISPGYIAGEMTGVIQADWRKFWEELIPFHRMGTADELAGAVIYLISEASSYTSGANMIIDGCFTCV